MRALVLAVFLVFALGSRGTAQRRVPLPATAPHPALAAPALAGADTAVTMRRTQRIAGRAGHAALGWVAAALVGAALGMLAAEACDCNVSSATAAFVGGVAVGPLGAGIGAAIPDYGSACGESRRRRRAGEAAAIGAVAAALLGSAASPDAAVALSIPGGIMGAVAGAELCGR